MCSDWAGRSSHEHLSAAAFPSSKSIQTIAAGSPDHSAACFTSYCCLCRDMIQKTFREKGLPYVSQLALQNVQELKGIIKWNAEHGIRLFRCTACLSC